MMFEPTESEWRSAWDRKGENRVGGDGSMSYFGSFLKRQFGVSFGRTDGLAHTSTERTRRL